MRLLAGAFVLATFACGCNGALDAHLASAYATPSGVTPVPSPSPTNSGSACPQGGSPYLLSGAVIVLMGPEAVSATSPFGQVAGYANNSVVPTPTPPTFPAAPIVISLAAATNVQFLNFDPVAVHAASGIAGSSFPPGYNFLTTATGTAIDTTGAWATGPISSGCYSVAFHLSTTGTFYFGDPSAYASGVRDVLQVTQ